RELEHLAGHRVLDTVHARDAVADRDDAADLGDVDVHREAADLFADDLGYFVGFDVHLFLREGTGGHGDWGTTFSTAFSPLVPTSPSPYTFSSRCFIRSS